MPPPARNTHHPQTSSRIRTTLSNMYRQNVTTKHGRQEHKQSITKSNHRDIAGISKSESQQPYNKGGLLKTTRWTHNSAWPLVPGLEPGILLSHGSDPYLNWVSTTWIDEATQKEGLYFNVWNAHPEPTTISLDKIKLLPIWLST